MEKDHNVDVLKLTDKDFLRSLENCMRFGKQCLLENLAKELDPALEPILLQQVGSYVIIYVRTCTHTYVHTYIRTHTTHACTYIHNTHTYIRMYIYMTVYNSTQCTRYVRILHTYSTY